jgi:4'-phosphopantetheinyl transferase EntD
MDFDPSFLSEEELLVFQGLGESARVDFVRGRYCAKRALEKLGFTGAQISLLRLPDGQVSWPEGIVGSISHAPGLAGAVVTKKTDFQSIGLDIELANRVQKSVWNRLFTAKEQELLDYFPENQQQEKATEIYSLKEAFYKFQWPITGTFLGMRDVEWNGNGFEIFRGIEVGEYRCLSLRKSKHWKTLVFG